MNDRPPNNIQNPRQKFVAARLVQFVPFAIFLLAVILRLLPGERIVDDAYITYRYARNLIEGAGFVYNPGERVLGTTTPLYTLLMAGLAFLFQADHYPTISIWVNALADGVTCALLAPLGELVSGRRRVGLAAGVLYAIAPFGVRFAIGGMETSVFVLMLVLTALLYLRKHMAWALTASLALLTRPDALIFIGPIGLDFAVRWFLSVRTARSAALPALLKPSLLFLLPLTPWLIFATVYFGSPIPHSIAAKSAAYHLNPADGVVRLWQHYSTPFFENVAIEKSPLAGIKVPVGGSEIPLANFWPMPGIIFYLSLYCIGWYSCIKRDTRVLAIGAYPLLYFITFAVANPLIFLWYLTPPLPFYFVFILAALAGMLHALDSRIRPVALRGLPFALAVVLLACFSLSAWVPAPDHGPRRPAPEMAWFKLEEIYTQVGKELAPEVTPQTVIAAGDIGALGYFSRARILDTLGLISPQSTRYYPLTSDQLVITYAIAADLIADQQPDFVVFLEVYGRRTLLVDPRFLENYTLREKIPTDIYGSDGMLIYEHTSPANR